MRAFSRPQETPKPALRIKTRFSPRSPDQWHNFLALLRARHEVTEDAEHSEFVIIKKHNFPSAHFLCAHLLYAPNESYCSDSMDLLDGLIGYERQPNERHVYLAIWMLLRNWRKLQQPMEDIATLLRAKRHFCVMISRSTANVRCAFYDCLSRYRRLDALGMALRNRPRPADLRPRRDKHDLDSLPAVYRRYKFALAFENASYGGYTSEKIFCALLGRTVPIYWGDPRITDFVNPDCFINAHDFAGPQELADYVLKVDADPALYRRYLSAPVFRNHRLVHDAQPEALQQRLAQLLHRLHPSRTQPRSVRSIFLRECLSRLESDATRRIVPHPQTGSNTPQAWDAPRRVLAQSPAAKG